MDYNCKHCGAEFENKGDELSHYRQYPKGACAGALAEGVSEDKKIHAPVDSDAIDVFEQQEQKAIEQQVASIGKEHARRLKEDYPQVKMVIPKDKLNKSDNRAYACTQGYIWNVKKGEKVTVPQPVYELFVEGGYQPTIVP